MTTTTIRRAFRALLLAAWGAAGASQAAPTLPQVAAGQASFSQQGNVFSIVNTPGTIINWQSFNVNAGEVTRFVQQGADSAVLNRVLGQDPSKILGALQSNGKVFLINPNGILFGQGARVDVNGLVASTLDIADADFLAGKKNFTAGPRAGTVRNDGAITTPNGGRVFLIAPDVQNTGIVNAPNGEVVLAAGRSVQLVDAADPDLRVVVSSPEDRAVNLGQVIAQGGRIGIYGALVNQRGVVSADSAVRGADGKVVLKASRAATLGAGSVTSARGSVDGARGGDVHVLGDAVAVQDDALVDASGRAGGGNVLLGGDWQGSGGLPQASRTTFASGAVVRADALAGGSGGKVVLWSTGQTSATGSIFARGAGGGSGGRVETSGHTLAVDGIRVDTGAARGRQGTWLLDPFDIVVSATPGAAGPTYIAPETLTANANNDVVLQAQNDVTINEALVAGPGVRVTAGNDITVNAQVASRTGDLAFSAGHKFTLSSTGKLQSNNNIDILADVMAFDAGIGSIGAYAGQKPVLSLSTATPGRAIRVGSPVSGDVLSLDATALGFLAENLFELNLGNGQHTGPIDIAGQYRAPSHLVLDNAGPITVSAWVNLSGRDSQFVASLYGNDGAIGVSGPIVANKVVLQGDRIVLGVVPHMHTLSAASVTLMPHHTGTVITVGASQADTGFVITQQALDTVDARTLTIGGLDGATGSFTVKGATLSSAGSLSVVRLDAGAGALAFDGPFTAPGLHVDVRADGIGGSGLLTGAALNLVSTNGIGGNGAPLKTATAALDASNSGPGNKPINIANQGELELRTATQTGAGNTGAITIDNVGGMTVPAYVGHDDGSSSGLVSAPGGDIALVTHSPLTIKGRVMAQRGNVSLTAGNDGLLTIAPGAHVEATRGSVTIVAGSRSIAPGTIVSNTNTDPDHGGDGDHGTGPAKPPPLDTCLASPKTAGCDDVVGAAVQACVANINAPRCGDVLPTDAVCQAQPSTPGCSAVAVRDRILACAANIAGPGCDTVLPPYDSCVAASDNLGCAAVIRQHDAVTACLATPAAPSCAATLPPYETCVAKSSTYGCAPVVQRHDAITVCMRNVKAPGCDVTLPPLDECRGNPAVYGCSAVLARAQFDVCLANPLGAGCDTVLPPLEVCKQSAAPEGCPQVLEAGFQTCLRHPHDASCSGLLPPLGQCVSDRTLRGCDVVLPTLVQCVADRTLGGCDVVLPTLAQCTGSPSLQGCEVRLPTLAACAQAPATPGCQAVLPTADFCGAHPGDVNCVVFTGNGGGQQGDAAPLGQAIQQSVHLIDGGTQRVMLAGAPGEPHGGAGQEPAPPGGPDGKRGGAPGPAQPQNTGAKNDKPLVKNYCN